jgi:hypothetical protein
MPFQSDVRSNNLDALFEVLFANMPTVARVFPDFRFRESSEVDVQDYIGNRFPIRANKVTANDMFDGEVETDERNYRFIQANYDGFHILFKFGVEKDLWHAKLFAIGFTITAPKTTLPDTSTIAFEKLTQLHGPCTSVEPFQRGRDSFNNNLNLYLWTLPGLVVQYRNFRKEQKPDESIVVCYWDSAFYGRFPYWMYA